MKKTFPFIAIFMLTSALFPNGDPTYRLEYQICGSAVSRLLLIIPIRFYYDASAEIDLKARPGPDGATVFTYAGIPRSAYILRTLGFSGKTVALLSVDQDEEVGKIFVDQFLLKWQKQAPEFAERVKVIKKFPHLLTTTGPEAFAFERDGQGYYNNFTVGLEPRYKYHPAKIGIYFKVFPMLAELLKLLNHRFTPGQADAPFGPFPAEWTGDGLDFSDNLNRVAVLLEKIVKSKVKVQQKSPLRLHFRIGANNSEEMEICGESYPDVPLWKGFMIKEIFRRVRLRQVDRALLADELWMGVRNSKGQGGFCRLQLKMIASKEDKK
ncbi:MAG TPA: hypothetical protein VMZ49_00690 [Patescibacteria group bacterium]|nr:hypothetical protein [Patescibacteria group bacterium]